MRAELRAQLPRVRGCGALIVVGIIIALIVAGVLIWNWVQERPARVVQKAMSVARAGNVQGLKLYLTEASVSNPQCDQWLGQLSRAFQRGALKREEIVGDEATVHVIVIQRSAQGLDATTDLGVKATREARKGWLIDLGGTMASAGPQFWESLEAAP